MAEEKATPEASEEEATAIWSQEDYHFYGQRPHEQVMLVRHQHIIILLPVIVICLVSLLIPFVALRFLHGTIGNYILIIYLVVVCYYLFHHVYAYRQSVSILSNERIVNVIQKGFFHSKITEAELNRIQDVATDIKGVLQTAFGFGDVTIRTASESVLVLKNIGTPYDVQQAIVRALKDAKHSE